MAYQGRNRPRLAFFRQTLLVAASARGAGVADWVAISSLATAGGTLTLAETTYASVRSANRAARAAERSLLAELRPLLVPSRLDDPQQKIRFADGKHLVAPGGGGAVEVTPAAIYLGLSLRNVGSGIGVLHGWYLYPERRLARDPRAGERADRRHPLRRPRGGPESGHPLRPLAPPRWCRVARRRRAALEHRPRRPALDRRRKRSSSRRRRRTFRRLWAVLGSNQ